MFIFLFENDKDSLAATSISFMFVPVKCAITWLANSNPKMTDLLCERPLKTTASDEMHPENWIELLSSTFEI